MRTDIESAYLIGCCAHILVALFTEVDTVVSVIQIEAMKSRRLYTEKVVERWPAVNQVLMIAKIQDMTLLIQQYVP